MTLTEIILANAERARNLTVHVESIYGTVSIKDVEDGQECFLQGDEGSAFVSEARRLWEESGDVTMTDVYLHLALPYAENLFN